LLSLCTGYTPLPYHPDNGRALGTWDLEEKKFLQKRPHFQAVLPENLSDNKNNDGVDSFIFPTSIPCLVVGRKK
jgi:hypothetical protein